MSGRERERERERVRLRLRGRTGQLGHCLRNRHNQLQVEQTFSLALSLSLSIHLSSLPEQTSLKPKSVSFVQPPSSSSCAQRRSLLNQFGHFCSATMTCVSRYQVLSLLRVISLSQICTRNVDRNLNFLFKKDLRNSQHFCLFHFAIFSTF